MTTDFFYGFEASWYWNKTYAQQLVLLIQNNLYRLEVCHHAKTLRFLVSDKDHAYSEKIGEVKIMAGSLLSGDRIEGKDAKNKFNLCKGAFNNYMYKKGEGLGWESL